MKKQQVLFLLMLLAYFAYGNPLVKQQDNFSLALSFEEAVQLKETLLHYPDGSALAADKGTQTFKANVGHYSVVTLSVTYASPGDTQEKYITMALFLQPGETKLHFSKNPTQYLLYGTSAENHAIFKTLQIRDEALLKKIHGATTSLNKTSSEGKNVRKELQDSISRWEQERRENVYGDFIRQHPNSLVSLYALHMYASINREHPQEVQTLINTLSDRLQKMEEVVALLSKATNAR